MFDAKYGARLKARLVTNTCLESNPLSIFNSSLVSLRGNYHALFISKFNILCSLCSGNGNVCLDFDVKEEAFKKGGK